jgi:hypothetical protein
MRFRMLWPMAIVLAVLAALDAFFWYQAAHVNGTDRTALISSASALLVAVAGVGGAAVGAYITAEYSREAAPVTDRRAAYARFLGAIRHHDPCQGSQCVERARRSISRSTWASEIGLRRYTPNPNADVRNAHAITG